MIKYDTYIYIYRERERDREREREKLDFSISMTTVKKIAMYKKARKSDALPCTTHFFFHHKFNYN